MAPELTIIVPAFNEAARLGDGMRRFEAAVESGAIDVETTEVVVVDDGSTDATEASRPEAPRPPPPPPRGPPPGQPREGRSRPHRAWPWRPAPAPPTWTPTWRSTRSRSPCSSTVSSHTTSRSARRALPASMVESTYAVRSLMGRLFNQLVTTGTGSAAPRHPVRVQGIPNPRRPPAVPPGDDRPLRLRRRGPDPCATVGDVDHRGARALAPRPGKHHPSRSTTRSRCSPTSTEPQLGLVQPASVTTVFVRDTEGRRPDPGDRPPRIGSALAPVLGGTPVPVLLLDAAVAVLLALVAPSDTTAALGALRAALDTPRSFGPADEHPRTAIPRAAPEVGSSPPRGVGPRGPAGGR